MVILDLIYTKTEFRPDIIYVDSQMDYPETLPFIQQVCDKYDAKLHIAKGTRTPIEQWHRQGWPMLGKMPARKWMQKHKYLNFGIKVDASSCCRNMKILPGRKMTKKLNADIQITGQRGGEDDRLRGLRAIKDGSVVFVKADNLNVFNPLLGWTDLMIRRYTNTYDLAIHPRKKDGAGTIGCIYCGGGAKFVDSPYMILRKIAPVLWRRFIVDWAGGEIIFVIKYNKPLQVIRDAIKELGGLDCLYDTRPYLFDYLQMPPLGKSYNT